MKLILDLNNPDRKYKYNCYSVWEYDDGAVSENSRKIESDNLNDFLEKLKELFDNKENDMPPVEEIVNYEPNLLPGQSGHRLPLQHGKFKCQ